MNDIDNIDFLNRTVEDLVELVTNKTTDLGDDIRTYGPEFFLDPDRFEREKEKIFRKTPLFMAFSGELPNPGDVRAEVMLDVPVMLVRDREGKARAFLNACRHRGTTLVQEPCMRGTARITCPYHLWTYGLDGRLLAILDQPTFGEVDKKELGLIELPCQEKYGLIYIALSHDVEIDLDKILGDHAEVFGKWHFENSSFMDSVTLEYDLNWKIALDTYCESYHLSGAHKNSLGVTKINNCTPFRRFGEKNRSHYVVFPEKEAAQLVGKDRDSWGYPFNYFSYIYVLYPNTVVSIFPETSLVWRIFPGKTPDTSVTLGTSIARSPEPDPELLEKTKANLLRVLDLIKIEDYAQGLGSMAAIKSGLFPGSLIGRNEAGITNLHEAFREAADS